MLIIDMPMPKNCPECHFSTTCSFCEGYDDVCVLAPKDAVYKWNFSDGIKPSARPSWCPIKGVLPDEHGDLIDRDKAKDAFDSSFLTFRMKDGETMRGFYQRTIAELPTVIAAERKDDER
jgi:hypothetical protein